MSEGLQLHWDSLNSISSKLNDKGAVTELMADIRDLAIQIDQVTEYF